VGNELEQVLAYHQASKHHYNAYARGPGYLDWANQPDPFRRYHGASLIRLEHLPPGDEPLYDPAFIAGHVPPQPLTRSSISQLFYDSLALSAWKEAGGSRWSLRVNPSSGNLHPTEGYLVCGPVDGLSDTPVVCHYAPREHALEVRARFPLETWQSLTEGLPPGTILVGLTSIHWREAWKYGLRGFRYCQHDAGHAIGAVAIAAGGLGWEARLLDDPGTEERASLLGVWDPQGAEPEYPECVLAVFPQGQECRAHGLPAGVLSQFRELSWQGQPNVLSPEHVDWGIETAAAAARKPRTREIYGSPALPGKPREVVYAPISLRRIIRGRRSAVAMDGRTGIARAAFYQILLKTLAGPGSIPFTTLPWEPVIHLGLFVHRVHGLDPGLYVLVRAPARKAALQAAMRGDFDWEKAEGAPADLGLYRLLTGDARGAAARLSCLQEIAGDGCFSLGMIADFQASLERYGPWFYPRLFWECGVVGQVLYLEAEAFGIRATGIGCYFDDPVHAALGLEGMQFQSLYHFTAGGAVEDPRLTTLPAYPEG
jgi:SagB-type dehydrogenase family enzyme